MRYDLPKMRITQGVKDGKLATIWHKKKLQNEDHLIQSCYSNTIHKSHIALMISILALLLVC
ncbi:hypothetical protein DWZ10_06620 [Segatella copri]|uniref:Uncharacterized protein n=1 Tax=Segatella copri TaxID=165179 RepID=A0AA92T5B7_9BACT|nr:hypothetical protein DXB80_07600 [Segatella copri]RGQ10164.1 hypothetical protein DWZ10_06620 [Segatella copri]